MLAFRLYVFLLLGETRHRNIQSRGGKLSELAIGQQDLSGVYVDRTGHQSVTVEICK